MLLRYIRNNRLGQDQGSVMGKAIRTVAIGALVVAISAGASAASGSTAAAAEERPITVFAGASLKNALDTAAEAFHRETGKSVTAAYAGTPALAKQIEAGAPADVFVSADRDWMSYLAARDLIRAETRHDFLGNSLVLIAPRSAPVRLRIAPAFPLSAAVADRRLAMANTAAVPAGKYGKAALQSLGVWESISGRIAQTDNVRAALALVSRGEVPLGIVYRSDAIADPGVVIVDTFPADSHPPIVYPIAVTAGSNGAGANAFVRFLTGSHEARRAFEVEGFMVLSGKPGY